ncbi:2-hydroxyacid dehydrogenase [Nitzschia inconspicua]|uniref:2-hydroxyacid dehydrogenase n=1 Tax=Nitzschia inconspicua TaxID=303405 RepID=A0A9K3LIV4_9STRA|nr:D-isomer specific 2-hydroxyacid dehydrogenase, NAD binding domain containing protein [Nitzschia inconspicua]KAG7362448.1 2-hydroxyacid dehydrogenase [Nitzschia inconspicua]
MSLEDKIRIFKNTKSWSELPDELLVELAEIMTMEEVGDNHIFIKEGEVFKSILIVDIGKLVRTKLSCDDSEKAAILAGTAETIKEQSVVVDEILGTGEGHLGGHATGTMHNFEPNAKAYATVISSGPKTRVWKIPGDKFREIVAKPQYALPVMVFLANEVRAGSKSIRTMLNQLKQGVRGESSSGANDIKVLCFDATSWVVDNFKPAVEEFNKEHMGSDNPLHITMDYTTERLSDQSATFAAGYDAVCLFVNDTANASTIQTLSKLGVKMIANRCAGFDRVDTKAALAYGITLARVPAYSPYAVAEMAISLLMGINRKITRASNRVKMANFSLDAGLMGVDIHGKTVGVMGTGKIGQILCNIIHGFGANIICYDVFESDEVKAMGGKYVSKDEIFAQSDILFLMMPLLPQTKHTINDAALEKLKPGVLLINSSRGGLVDTNSVLKGIQSGIIGGYGADVYENEGDYFFQDWSARNISDPTLVSLLGNNNVLLTAHQAFFTQEAVDAIVNVTIDNLKQFKEGKVMYEHPNTFLPPRK